MSLSTKVLFFFLLAVVFSTSENTCISMFFNKFSSNIEKFKANGLEFFNITWEFNEKHQNTSVFRCGNNNSEEEINLLLIVYCANYNHDLSGLLNGSFKMKYLPLSLKSAQYMLPSKNNVCLFYSSF